MVGITSDGAFDDEESAAQAGVRRSDEMMEAARGAWKRILVVRDVGSRA